MERQQVRFCQGCSHPPNCPLLSLPPSQCVLNTPEFFFIVCDSLLLSVPATDLVLLGLQGYLSLVLSQSCLGGECLVDILECRGILLFRPSPSLEDSSGHLISYESEYRLTRA